MSGSGFAWVQGHTPTDLHKGFRDYGRNLLVALHAAAGLWGQTNQDEARRKAIWTDRTGNARSSIFYAVDGLGLGELKGNVSVDQTLIKDKVEVRGDKDSLVIVVSHSVFYGKFLESKNGGRYAIIMSTMESNLPRLERLIQHAFKSALKG